MIINQNVNKKILLYARIASFETFIPYTYISYLYKPI